jgi:hypothetical protein
MKKIGLLILIIFSLVACGGGDGDQGDNDGADTRELALDETVSGSISQEGEVDWYHVSAVEVNRTLTVSLNGTRQNSPVDFMVTIYERNESGDFVTVFGESAKEDVFAPANINIDVAVGQPRDLYIAVRDFKDDDASEDIRYQLVASYSDEVEDNDTFEEAIILQVGSGQVCHTETIYPVSDVDCYRFTIGGSSPAGVYRITAQYDVSDSTPIPVNLDLELYDEAGQLVQEFRGQRPADKLYVLLPYLDVGDYFMVIGDQGSNDESQYDYSFCIEPVNASEVMQNDTAADAQSCTPTATDGDDINGSLEYAQDQDWYVFDVPPATGNLSQNIRINFFHDFDQVPDVLTEQVSPAGYLINVHDAQGNVIHSHNHSVLAVAPYNVEIASGAGGQNFISIQPIYTDQLPVALPYQMNVELRQVSDDGESADGQEVTTVLDPNGETVTGKIFKLGDVDNYQITVDTTTGPKTLELFFDTTELSEVAYTVHVNWDGKHRILSDNNGTANGEDEGAHFKSSFYLPQTSGSGTTVSFQVCDDQNNDGSDVTYTLRTGVLAIPASISLDAETSAVVTSTPVYFDEPDENADLDATTVTVIEFDNANQPQFKANTAILDVTAAEMSGNTWQSNWIAGFVDYDGDRDLFELNFDDVTQAAGAPEEWYFDIQVQMFAPAGNVEYSWTLFRDRQPNEILVERTFWENTDGEDFEYDPNGEGIVACWADMEITAETHNVTIPSSAQPEFDHPFWVGNRWGSSKFYISINDFNRAVESRNWDDINEAWVPTPNQIPDNDWGNSNSTSAVRPYYFRVTVTYHPDCSSPDEGACAPE